MPEEIPQGVAENHQVAGGRLVIRHKTPHALGTSRKHFALESINKTLFKFAQQVTERDFKFAIQVCFPRLINIQIDAEDRMARVAFAPDQNSQIFLRNHYFSPSQAMIT